VRSAYCYSPSSVVCRSVSRSLGEPCKNGWSDRDAVCRLLHIADCFGRILYCVHLTLYSLLVCLIQISVESSAVCSWHNVIIFVCVKDRSVLSDCSLKGQGNGFHMVRRYIRYMQCAVINWLMWNIRNGWDEARRTTLMSTYTSLWCFAEVRRRVGFVGSSCFLFTWFMCCGIKRVTLWLSLAH